MAVNYCDDYEYARDKLTGSYIQHENVLAEVVEVFSDCRVVLMGLDGREFIANLSELNLEPPKLGYVNMNPFACYVSRMPVRHFRQGFRRNTIRATNSLLGNMGIHIDKSFLNCYKNIYPDLDHAVESVYNEESSSKAFSKNFAVSRMEELISLDYKGRQVGRVNTKTQDVTLDNNFLFLEEVLEACL